jgi:hypothetical protein
MNKQTFIKNLEEFLPFWKRAKTPRTQPHLFAEDGAFT